ncbi:hypothetical protein DPEC_G00047000 [Dallia pectoralis]|uniref:Uncharacterized protein n=1 Tax=Dallia pectoralis TaxID=75939 RepID=A0ACC2HAW4_DALPE|nr:hypothetical protein DPEC_G00047000 [Dallia pectoralis]
MDVEESNAPPHNPKVDGVDRSGDLIVSQVVEIINGTSLGAIRSLEQHRDTAAMDEDSVFYEDGEALAHLVFGSTGKSAETRSGEFSLHKAELADVVTETGINRSGTYPMTDGADTESACCMNKRDTGLLQDTINSPSQPQIIPHKTMTQGTTQKPELIQGQPGKETIKNKVSSACQEVESTALPVPDVMTHSSGTPNALSSSRDELYTGSQDEENTDNDSQDPLACQDYSGEQSAPPGHEKPSDHTSSKYNTLSYRQIRRGNTKQKIDEYESIMMNM